MSSHGKAQRGGVPVSEINPRLQEEIQKLLVEGRLPCEEAHKLAQRLGIDLLEIGAAANALNVKVSRCQLGCF